ncbi:MAG TPA: hypothetical protein VFC51_05950 [Chloroflexota bacterium]|nr:hypothetical protein [Chloroflexota bacterium]
MDEWGDRCAGEIHLINLQLCAPMLQRSNEELAGRTLRGNADAR